MRFLALCLCPVIVATMGCATSKPARQMKPPQTEEFMLPPQSADGRPLDPPAYPEEKRNLFTPKKSELPASLRDASTGAGPTGSGMGSGPIRNGGAGGN